MSTKQNTSRRNFLKSSIALPAAVASIPASTAIAAKAASSNALPTRKLGANGPEVSMLNLGGLMTAHSTNYMELAWKMGIRYFDTAFVYKKGQSERDVGAWVRKHPELRKEAFIVSKNYPRGGMHETAGKLDECLENMGVDYVDLYFIHAMGPKPYGEESLNWFKSDEMKKIFEDIKASGKAKMCGFSCHDALLVDYLNAAADGGFVDAIMFKYDPLMEKGSELDQAIQRCYDAGIGLIAMKTMRAFKKAPLTHPDLESSGLTMPTAVLKTIWSDKRMSSLCSAIENVQQMEENTEAARSFDKPIDVKKTLGELASLTDSTMCPGCPSCAAWARKTEYAFQDVSRYVMYYEHDGNREARDYFRSLSQAERSHAGVNLAQISEDCSYNIDYAEIARRSEKYFA
ncbi:MAG: aldo/keto reductase [Puniceicoccaceae bacterium]